MPRKNSETHYALCLDNEGCRASLEVRKIYQVVPDPEAEREGLIRVIDNSGEDYLYEESSFVLLKLPRDIEKLVAATL
jgi:hypothetical protein